MRASRNVALDAVRQEKVFRDKEGEQLTEEDRKIMNQYVIRGKD